MFARYYRPNGGYILKRIFILFAALLVFAPATFSQTGKIDERLSRRLQSATADSLVPVWIVLPEVRSAAAHKALAPAVLNNRVERYRARAARMRQDHTAAQAGLVNYLAGLERRGLAANIKTHWLVNIVEAQLRPDQIDNLAQRPDIESIHAVPELIAFEPSQMSDAESQAGVEIGLKAINADDAWAAGFTGKGRIICSFDTGIDGDHPALFESWKGHDGDSAAAWFDPLEQQSFPHTISGPSRPHGTHVMGTLLGHDDATGDTIGVALDARWISAAVIDIFGTSIIDAFEWAADPDRNPNTVDDLPDVINHSWGVSEVGCVDVFFQMIDNIEALGIVNIFAAGNEGSNPLTIRNPANRALDSLDCFAVGNVDARTSPSVVSSQSSRGPSDCNGAIKPNVTAPGTAIRSSLPGGFYGSFTGTSMAAPHVSGLVALIREKNPNATVEEIKTAILTTTQTFGYTLPDNSYGWGIIDCMAALNAISAINNEPNVRVYAYDHPPVAPGDQFAGRVVLQNLGDDVFNLTGTVTGSDPSVTIVDATAAFGTINEGDTARATDDIVLAVSDTVTPGRIISLDFQLTGTGYSKSIKLHILLEPLPNRMMTDLSSGKIQFTITNFGTYGMGDLSFFPAGGVGFRYAGSDNEFWQAGLMIGRSFSQVSDGIQNAVDEPDGDFAVAPSGDLVVSAGAGDIAEQSWARYDDSRTKNPIGVEITQETFGYDIASSDDFVIIKYEFTNTSGQAISGMYAGLFLDWDLANYLQNAGGWIGSSNLAWMAYNNPELATLENFRGAVILDGQPASGLTTLGTIAYDSDGLTEFEKFEALTDGFGSANTYNTASQDLLQVVSVGPISLQPGESTTAAFALMGAASQQGLIDAATTAALRYAQLPNGCCIGTRGDVNGDGVSPEPLDLSALVDYLYFGGALSSCPEENDVNGDGANGGAPDVIDLATMVDILFYSAPPIDCP